MHAVTFYIYLTIIDEEFYSFLKVSFGKFSYHSDGMHLNRLTHFQLTLLHVVTFHDLII